MCTYMMNGHILATVGSLGGTTGMGCASMFVGAVFVVLARVAQRIERHRPKVGVGGSSPSAGTDVDARSAPSPSRFLRCRRQGEPAAPRSHPQGQEGARRWRFRFAVTASRLAT